MRAALTALVAATPACAAYAKIATTNAPGVVDIATPIAHETGADDLYEAPVYDKPANNAYVVWLHPAFGGGLVRHGAGYEVSFGVSVEKESADATDVPIARTAWGVSAGIGIAQFRDTAGGTDTITEAPGPASLEVYYRKFIVMFAAGAVIYPDTRDAGAQITIHAPLCQVRARLVQDSGFEVMLAYDFNFPLVFGWSK